CRPRVFAAALRLRGGSTVRGGHSIVRSRIRRSRVGGRPSLVGRLQICRNQVIRQPERSRWVGGIRCEIPPVVSIPGCPAPAPSVIDRRRPRIIGPSVITRPVEVGGGGPEKA